MAMVWGQRKIIGLLAAVVAAASLFAACSGGGGKATPTPTAAAETPATVPTPTPVPEVINGVTVTPSTAGDPIDIPENAVIYVEGGCTQCDGPATSLDRVYRDAAGTLHSDRLFERQLPREDIGNGQTRTLEKNYIRSIAIADGGYTILISVCTRGYCGGVGNLSDDAQTTLYNSTDGGVTWNDLGTIDGGVFLVDAQKGGGIGQRTWKDANGAWQFAYQYLPGGESLPSNIDAKEAWVTSIGNHHPVVRAENKTALYWLAGASAPDLDPQLPAGSVVEAARLSPSGYATDTHYLVQWRAPGGQAYLGLMKARDSAPSTIIGGSFFDLARGGEWITGNLVVGNFPTVLDLQTGQAHPIEPLADRAKSGDRTRILAAVPGPWLKVKDAGDCLNVRVTPSMSADSLGCFKDGVLLRDRGENRSAEGLTWIAVFAPNGAAGWASAEYLDTAGRNMTVPPLSHPKGTRTGNGEVDPVLDAIESGDAARQVATIRFTLVPCVVNPQGLGAPPTCAAGEAEGTPIEVLPQACAEGYYRRKTSFSGENPFIYPDLSLYAVVRQSRQSSPQWPQGHYAILYRSPETPDWSIQVNVEDAKIVSVSDCLPRPQDVLNGVPAADFLLAPPR